MKVARSGKFGNPRKWKATVICRKRHNEDEGGCGAELHVSSKDLVLMHWFGTHFQHFFAAVKCPECGHHNSIPTLPDPLWDKLNTRHNQRKSVFSGTDERI